MNLFISPHNDDETLFGAFTLCRERDTILVAVVFDGYTQSIRDESSVTFMQRRDETIAALAELGVKSKPLWGELKDSEPDWEGVRAWFVHLRTSFDPVHVYAPAVEVGGHAQHNNVGSIAVEVFGMTVKPYLTYTSAGKSTDDRNLRKTTGYTMPVLEVIAEPDWIVRKHRALAQYESQVYVTNCREHFLRDMREYYA